MAENIFELLTYIDLSAQAGFIFATGVTFYLWAVYNRMKIRCFERMNQVIAKDAFLRKVHDNTSFYDDEINRRKIMVKTLLGCSAFAFAIWLSVWLPVSGIENLLFSRWGATIVILGLLVIAVVWYIVLNGCLWLGRLITKDPQLWGRR